VSDLPASDARVNIYFMQMKSVARMCVCLKTTVQSDEQTDAVTNRNPILRSRYQYADAR